MMGNELCAQRLADERLAAILATFAPGCVPAELALEQLGIMINLTIGVLKQETCAEVEILLPSTLEGTFNFLSVLNDPEVIRTTEGRASGWSKVRKGQKNGCESAVRPTLIEVLAEACARYLNYTSGRDARWRSSAEPSQTATPRAQALPRRPGSGSQHGPPRPRRRALRPAARGRAASP